MNTNDLSNYTQVANEAVGAVMRLGPELFTILVCLVVGYALKLIPAFTNNWIPPILVFVVGPAVYCMISDPDLESWINMRFPIVRQIALGFCWGFAAWAIHRAFLQHWLDKRFFPTAPPANTIPDSAAK